MAPNNDRQQSSTSSAAVDGAPSSGTLYASAPATSTPSSSSSSNPFSPDYRLTAEDLASTRPEELPTGNPFDLRDFPLPSSRFASGGPRETGGPGGSGGVLASSSRWYTLTTPAGRANGAQYTLNPSTGLTTILISDMTPESRIDGAVRFRVSSASLEGGGGYGWDRWVEDVMQYHTVVGCGDGGGGGYGLGSMDDAVDVIYEGASEAEKRGVERNALETLKEIYTQITSQANA
ncbi:hypothetical protein L202_02612 [Cryptococcus amylolentus CBS 6039]|uniref:Uncharacterized protein n=1 Tax=Cryptococcus amylolentus CBS 6039 TaxID=1295533 RepID=A0A1E3HVK0_9TREE|nr:hypothetical protein L202_02612 [Cryptococcus amylolentus CBS 6039]ODN80352.1 hypothetical protein L202_02612 [Cryptococcus amylolentus CBS 6039]